MAQDTFKYSYKQTLRENTGLAVYNSGLQKCAPGYSWGPAIRDHYLIHYVASGKGTYRCESSSFPLQAGDLFLVYPETIVCYTADSVEPWEYYWVGFHGADAKRLLQLTDFSRERLVLHHDTKQEEIEKLLIAIYEAHGSKSSDDAAMTGHLYLFLSRLLRESSKGASHAAQSSVYFEKAVKFIGLNFGQELTICDIANHVALSRSQLYRIFLRESGMSPVVFLSTYRINEACGLLRSHNLTVSQTAASVGFTDPLYFSRLFKKIKGVSPTEYKQQSPYADA